MCAVFTAGDTTGNDRRVMLGVTFIFLESHNCTWEHSKCSQFQGLPHLSLGDFLVH